MVSRIETKVGIRGKLRLVEPAGLDLAPGRCG